MASFGKYQVLELIGEGGFSRVYRGYDATLKRDVAIKVVTLTAPQARERFMREAEIAANLRHPHIVTIFDFGEQDGQPYLVQEFLPGQDLDTLIRTGDTGDLRTRIGYLLQVAEGLHHAHLQGVVHRDVKPGNLRVLADGGVRVMDFGIAKTLDPDHDLTATGLSVGTSGYLAPEQLEGHETDHRADIFSFGVVAYELLTGRKPFAGETVTAVLYRILNEEPVAVAALAPDTPARLAACVDRCLRKQPDRRYPSLEEVMTELRAVLAELDRPAGAPGRPPDLDDAASVDSATAAFAGGEEPPEPQAPVPVTSGAGPAVEARRPETAEPWIRTRRRLIVVGAVVVIGAGLWAAVSVARALDGGRDSGDMALAVTDSAVADAAGPEAIDSGAADLADDPSPGGRPGPGAGSDTAGIAPGPADTTTGAPTDTIAPAPSPAIDPDRVVLLLVGDVPDAVHLAETTLLAELEMRGRSVVEQAVVASSGIADPAWTGEPSAIVALGREFGAGTVFHARLLVDTRRIVSGFVTGSAVLDTRVYDSATGSRIFAEKFQIGEGGVPGKAGSSDLDAISQATEAVARQAARAILQRTGSGR